MSLYQITDWVFLYENHESKKIINLRWVPIPNKQDGLSYKRIAKHEKAAEIFTAWILLLQIASKCPTRGLLSEDERGELPLTSEDFATKTCFPKEIFDLALPFLTDKRIRWIEIVKARKAVKQKDNTEFKIPDFSEVQAYCKERGNKISAEKFYKYYNKNGWRSGTKKITDWKAKARKWETDEFNDKYKGTRFIEIDEKTANKLNANMGINDEEYNILQTDAKDRLKFDGKKNLYYKNDAFYKFKIKIQ